jgi:hypothetical protein
VLCVTLRFALAGELCFFFLSVFTLLEHGGYYMVRLILPFRA